jgi:hypothetical protein
METKNYKLNVVYTDNSHKNFVNLKCEPYVEQGFLVVQEDNLTHFINRSNLFGYTVEQVK